MGKQGPCCHCGISTTPLWRNGPPEKPVLCNACGSRWRTKGTLLNYMPMHSGGCGVSDSPDYKWPRGKRGPQKFKEQRSHKRKEPCDAHQDVEFRAMKSNLQYARVLDEDVSTRSSSVSGITNSEGCMQHGCAAEKDNTVHTSVWDSPVPSKKRTCMFRQRPSSVEKLTKGMQYILQEQDSSYLSSSSEEDLLYEYKPPLVAVEIGLGSVFIRQPQSAIKEEESEASSLLIENKGCNTFDVLTQAYSGAVVPPGHLPYGDKIVTERWKENMELLQEHSAKSFIPNKALLESFLRSCHSPLIFMDLKDIVNFDTFTELLKDEEQMQLLKYVSSVDDSAVPESLKCMFTSVQFKGALSNFQQLLSEGMFDMYGSGLSPQVQQLFQQLLLVTDLTKSKWMDRYSHLQLRFKRRGLVDSAKHPENKDATKPKGPNLLGSLPKSAVHAALKDSSGRPPPGHSFAGSEKDKKNPVRLQRSGPATVYPFTPIWTNSSTDGGCYESIDTGSTSKELDSYLASGMLTEIPKLSISQSMMMCASTTSAETFGDKIVEAAMEEISECSQDSSATGCYHSGSFEAATTSPVGHEIFELQKAGEDGILNDELKDLTEHHLSKCSKTDGASLESEGEIGLSEVPIDQEVQTVTSNEINEFFFESVIAGSSCSVGSPRECTNTVNVSDCVGSSCFRVQPFVPTAVAEHMMTSSFSYTYQLSSSIDMVATSPSLCANPFSVSGSPLHSVAYDTMLSSLVNTGGASCSPEIPASAFNSSICNDGGYLQCASEFYRSDQLSQDCLPLIQDLKIDTRDEQPRPAVYSLSSIANGINQCNRMAEISNIETENTDTGSPFYEPPRLPN